MTRDEEKLFILENHKDMTIKQMADELRRRTVYVYHMASAMGLLQEMGLGNGNKRKKKVFKDGYFNVDEVGHGGNWIV